MSFRRSSRNQNFTVIYNEVAQHETMTMESRGLLLFMLSLPEDWEYHKGWLQDRCHGWGRDKMAKVLKELETMGYLIRTANQCQESGKMQGWVWEVFGESQNTDSLKIRKSDENSGETDKRICRKSDLPNVGDITATNKTDKTKKKITTTTTYQNSKIPLPEFTRWVQMLVSKMAEREGVTPPNPVWLSAKIAGQWGKYHQPDAADVSLIVVNDWINRMETA